jgi:hypothetical protein
MKTRHFLIIGTVAVLFAGAIFAGCKKDTTPTTTNTTTTYTDYTAAQDDANASSVVNDTKGISDGAAQGKAEQRTMGGYPVVIFNHGDTTLPGGATDSVLEINFGPTDMLCNDGRWRRGIIEVWYTPKGYWTQGDTIGMTFQGYYVNDIGVTGYRKLVNVGKDSAGFHTWSFTASLKLTYPLSGGTATWTSSRTNTLLKTGGVWYYNVTGTASGVSRKGTNYAMTITSPIYVTALPPFAGGCPYFESGAIAVTLASYNIGLTFGKGVGTCSDTATATINSHTYGFHQL